MDTTQSRELRRLWSWLVSSWQSWFAGLCCNVSLLWVSFVPDLDLVLELAFTTTRAASARNRPDCIVPEVKVAVMPELAGTERTAYGGACRMAPPSPVRLSSGSC
jgi:hypothetical protein